MNRLEVSHNKVIPLQPKHNGMWMRPETARHYFNNGKGIKYETLMNKIYSGELKSNVMHDHTGWFVWITEEALNTKNNHAA